MIFAPPGLDTCRHQQTCFTVNVRITKLFDPPCIRNGITCEITHKLHPGRPMKGLKSLFPGACEQLDKMTGGNAITFSSRMQKSDITCGVICTKQLCVPM